MYFNYFSKNSSVADWFFVVISGAKITAKSVSDKMRSTVPKFVL